MSELEIPIDLIDCDPNQPRRAFPDDESQEFAESLKSSGQLVPIILLAIGKRYQLVDGERRYRAAKLAGMISLRAEVLDHKPSRAELTILQLVVNAKRVDLLPLEELQAYESLMAELGCNATILAQKLCISKAKITRILSLRSLSDEQRALVQSGKLSSANAYAMSRMSESDKLEAMRHVAEGTLTRENAERLSARKGKDAALPIRGVQFQAGAAVVRVSSMETLSIDAILSILDQLARELKRARKEGLDVSTAVHVLRDRARRQSNGGAP